VSVLILLKYPSCSASKMRDMMSSVMGGSSEEDNSSGGVEVMVVGSNGQMMSG